MRTILGLALALCLAAPALAANTDTPPAAAGDVASPPPPSALVPPGASDVHAAKLDEQFVFSCISTTDASTITDFYRDVLEKDGWRETSDDRYGRNRIISFGKGEKGEAMLTLTPKGDEIAVLLMITP